MFPDVSVKVLPPVNVSKINTCEEKKMHPVVHSNHYGPSFGLGGGGGLICGQLDCTRKCEGCKRRMV